MIDNAVASSAANLDLKVQGKPGNKADKADKVADGSKKNAFHDAMKAQLHGRPDKGKTADGEDPLLAMDGVSEEGAGETADKVSNPVKTHIPRVHLNAIRESDAKPDSALAQIETADPEAKPQALDERKKAQAKEGLRLGERMAEKAADRAETETNGQTLETEVKKPVRDPHLKADKPEQAAEPEEKAAAPARDVLNLLADSRSHNADPMNSGLASHSHSAMPEPVPGTDGGEETIQRYRVSRADGRGGLIEIEGRDRTGDTDTPGAAQKASVQDVTVIEQRRFLAPSEQGNIQSVIQSMSGDPEWQVAMRPGSELANAAAQAGSGKVVNTLKIQMHPIELGLVTATMRLQGEELTVELKVHTGVAYKQLRDDQSQIIESLKAQGFNVDQVSVVFAPDRSDQASGQQSQTNGQGAGFAQSQQQARDGNQGNAPARLARIAAQERAGGNGNEQADLQVDGATGNRGAGGRSQSVWL